jgi:hypothetical protein
VNIVVFRATVGNIRSLTGRREQWGPTIQPAGTLSITDYGAKAKRRLHLQIPDLVDEVGARSTPAHRSQSAVIDALPKKEGRGENDDSSRRSYRHRPSDSNR